MNGKRRRHIGRYREIAAALLRHGFGFVVEEIGILQWLSLPQRLWFEKADKETKTVGERIRLVLEELGPTFVKLGQIASTRPDLIPAEITRELEKLQDRVAPFSFDEVRDIIEKELGDKLENIFPRFEERSLAAASIGQVHRAVLRSGEHVAVKVQRPNISRIMETDLEILHDLAILAESRLEWAAKYHLGDLVEEFSASLRAELDYMNEGRNAEKIAGQFRHDATVHIPKVFWEYTTGKVLTMEYMDGIKLNEPDRLKEQGYRPKILAERLANAFFRQIFQHGFFHGDPHPGNVLVLPGEVISFIDFGMTGRLPPELKYHFSSLIIALMRQDTDGILKAISRMGVVPDDADMAKLRDDLEQIKDKYYGIPLSQMRLEEVMGDLFRVARRHSIKIPANLTVLGKTLLTLEGVLEKLDPEFRIFVILEPFGLQLLKERLYPRNLTKLALRRVLEYGEIIKEIPRQTREIASLIKSGKLRVEILGSETKSVLQSLERIGNRLSFSIAFLAVSILVTGIVIGDSLGRQSTMLWKIPAAEIGFGMILLMFFWLLFSIFRSGRF